MLGEILLLLVSFYSTLKGVWQTIIWLENNLNIILIMNMDG